MSSTTISCATPSSARTAHLRVGGSGFVAAILIGCSGIVCSLVVWRCAGTPVPSARRLDKPGAFLLRWLGSEVVLVLISRPRGLARRGCLPRLGPHPRRRLGRCQRRARLALEVRPPRRSRVRCWRLAVLAGSQA